jgi:hypothetical protein
MGRDDKGKHDPIMDAFEISEDEEDSVDGLTERQTVVDDVYIADLRARLDSPSSDPGLLRERISITDSEIETEKAILAAFQDKTTEKLESELKGRISSRPPRIDSVPPPSPLSGGQRLYILCGPDAGRSLALTRDRVQVGRGQECELSLSDSSVSRLHLVLIKSEGVWLFEDQQSENGTYLDGQWTRKGLLHPGEPLELGRTMIVLEGNDP